ncbi:MAG: C39 family peptidase [Gaiellales bacterium]
MAAATTDQRERPESTGGWLARKTRELLLGTPVEPVDPASVHICQVADEVYNPGSPNATANCGPASVIMAIRLVGKKVPGEDTLRGEDLVLHVRKLATGATNRLRGTHNLHLQHVLELADCRWSVHEDIRDSLRRVREHGEPVIIAGNPAVANTYTARFPYYDIRRYDSGHWIVVSRYVRERGTYIINDPQSTIGPVEVTAAELAAFDSKDGGFGISVRPG